MRILFIGGTKRGYITLKALIDAGQEVVGVISLRQDDHEAIHYEESIRTLAEKLRIPCYETKWMKERDYGKLISHELKPDVAFVVGCRILIPKEIYEIPKLGTLAAHDSLLPNYRGFAPLNWAIINGEKETGVTLFYLSESTDGGDIVMQQRVPIGPDSTAPEVYEQVCQATVDLILKVCPLIAKDIVPRTGQDHAISSVTCSRTPEDGMIDWNQPTSAVYNLVRALTFPYPGAFTFYEGKKLMIWRAKPVVNPPRYSGWIPGRVVNISESEGTVDVLTADGVLRVFEVQLENEERTKATDVVRSIRSTLGLRTSDLLKRLQTLEQRLANLEGSTIHAP